MGHTRHARSAFPSIAALDAAFIISSTVLAAGKPGYPGRVGGWQLVTGTDVPKPGDERVHLNLWLFGGAAPSNGIPLDVAVESFAYVP